LNIYIESRRYELAANERSERKTLMNYMPKQMDDHEIKVAVLDILSGISNAISSEARIGKTMGEFNKKYRGMADATVVSNIIKTLI
jgi:uncharacterized protein YqeY